MPPSKGTIDSIKVAIGLDVAAVNRDLKSGLGGFVIEPQLRRPTEAKLGEFAKSISDLMLDEGKKKKLGVKVAVQFDEEKAKADLDALIRNINREAPSVKIPVEYVYPSEGPRTSPGGGDGGGSPTRRGGPGSTGGGGGGAAAPGGAPAASAAGAVAATAVAGSTPPPPRPTRAARAASTTTVAGAVAATAVASAPAATPPPTTVAPVQPPYVDSSGQYLVTTHPNGTRTQVRLPANTRLRPGQTVPAAAPAAPAAPAVVTPPPAPAAPPPAAAAPATRAPRRSRATTTTAADAAAAHAQEFQAEVQRQLQQQLAARLPAAPAAEPEGPVDSFDALYGARSAAPEPVKRLVKGNFKPNEFAEIVRAAQAGEPAAKGLSEEHQALYDYTSQISARGQAHRVRMQNAGTAPRRKGKGLKKALASESAQGLQLMRLYGDEDWEGIDEMFPGVGAALESGNVGEAMGMYYAQQYPGQAPWAVEGSTQAGRAAAIDKIGQHFGRLRAKEGYLAEDYPLDWSMQIVGASRRSPGYQQKIGNGLRGEGPRTSPGKRHPTDAGTFIKRPSSSKPKWPTFELPTAAVDPKSGKQLAAQSAALAELQAVRSAYPYLDWQAPDARQQVDALQTRYSKALTSLNRTRGGKKLVDRTKIVDNQIEELMLRETGTTRRELIGMLGSGGTIGDFWAGADDPDKLREKLTGLQGGGYKPGERWWRGGSSTQDLWTPGRNVVHGETMDDPFSTLGSGLYLTDLQGARSYADVRTTRGETAGGLPVVDSRVVDIPESEVWQPQGGYFDDRDLLARWENRLHHRIKETQGDKYSWLYQGGPRLTLEAIEEQRARGRTPALHTAIGAHYGVNQRVFSGFMQGEGYQGLLGQEGGEGPGGFLHPSLVVFDPKNKLLHRQGGGRWAADYYSRRRAQLKTPQTIIGEWDKINAELNEDTPPGVTRFIQEPFLQEQFEQADALLGRAASAESRHDPFAGTSLEDYLFQSHVPMDWPAEGSRAFNEGPWFVAGGANVRAFGSKLGDDPDRLAKKRAYDRKTLADTVRVDRLNLAPFSKNAMGGPLGMQGGGHLENPFNIDPTSPLGSMSAVVIPGGPHAKSIFPGGKPPKPIEIIDPKNPFLEDYDDDWESWEKTPAQRVFNFGKPPQGIDIIDVNQSMMTGSHPMDEKQKYLKGTGLDWADNFGEVHSTSPSPLVLSSSGPWAPPPSPLPEWLQMSNSPAQWAGRDFPADPEHWTTDPQDLIGSLLGPTSNYPGLRETYRATVDLNDPTTRGIFHVTGNMEGIRQRGLMSARQLQAAGLDIQGLGSHGSDLVSTTWSPERASNLRDILGKAGQAARGEIGPDEIADFYGPRIDPRQTEDLILTLQGMLPSRSPLRNIVHHATYDRVGELGRAYMDKAMEDAYQNLDDLQKAKKRALWTLFSTIDNKSFDGDLDQPNRRLNKGALFVGTRQDQAASLADVGILRLAASRHIDHPMTSPDEFEMKFHPPQLRIIEGMQRGGRPSSLSDLPGVAKNIAGITEVGEQGREWVVRQHDGSEFVVPNHQLPHFRKMVGMADGGPRIPGRWDPLPHPATGMMESGARVPLMNPDTAIWGPDDDMRSQIWRENPSLYRRRGRTPGYVARGQDFKGQRTSLPPSNPLGIEPPLYPTGRSTNRGVGPKGLFMMEGGSRLYSSRRLEAGAGPVSSGTASSYFGGGSVQRVAVVNWPAGITGTPGPRALGSPSSSAASSRAGHMLVTPPPAPPLPSSPHIGGVATTSPSSSHFRPTPLGRAQAKSAGQEAVSQLRSDLDQVGIDISESLQKSPVRALSVAMGQIAQTMVGGRSGILERAGVARAKRTEAEGLVSDLESSIRSRDAKTLAIQFNAQQAGVGVEIDEATGLSKLDWGGAAMKRLSPQERLDFQTAQREEQDLAAWSTFLKPKAEAATKEAQTSAKSILSGAQQVKAQAVGLVGIVGGTMMFTAAMQLAQFGLAAIGTAAAPVVDALLGFKVSLKEQTAVLAQSFQAAGGAPEGVYGGIVGSAMGITGARGVASTVGELAMRQQANENMKQQVSLLRAARGTEGINMTTAGFTQPTNGMFGTPLFATPSELEQVSGELIGNESGISNFDNDMLNEAVAEIKGGSKPGEKIWKSDIVAGKALLNQRRLDDLVNTQLEDKGFATGVGRLRIAAPNAFGEPASQEDREAVRDTLKALQEFDPQVSEAQLQRLEDAGVILDGLIPDDVEGNAKKWQALFNALSDANSRPDKNVMLTMMAPELEAQTRGLARERMFREQTIIPATVAQQYMAAPMPGMIGMPTTTGIISNAAGAGEQALASPYASGIRSVIDQLKPIQAQGRQELISLGVTPQQISEVEKLGASIAKLHANAGQIQLDLEMRQYNEQLYIAERSMGDILGILGKTGAATSELGRLQRSQILDSRELSRIQLARSQRELNLQLALSKLQAPGETAEERAVRQREAQIQVRMQQRELTLNKGMTERGFNIEDIGYQRQARDLGVQIALMKEAREVTIEVRGMNQFAEAKSALLAVRTEYMNTARDAGIEVRRMGFRVQQEIEARAGKFKQLYATEVQATMDTLLKGYTKLMDKYQAAIGHKPEGNVNENMGENWQGTVPEETRKQKQDKGPSAAGGIFSVNTPTRFIAGEAGNEGIVILRNPRSGVTAPSTSMQAMGGGGGGVSISLILNATVRGEADETRLAHKVAKALHREAAILVGA